MKIKDYKSVRGSCTIHIVLFVIAFSIITAIRSAFIYVHWYLKRSSTETVIY